MSVITPSQFDPSRPPAPSTVDALRRLRSMVQRDAGRWKFWIILEALALAIGVPLAYLLLVLLLDNLLHLSIWSRLLANAILIAATIYLLISLVRRWRRLRLSEDQVALAMEQQTPGGVQNRLINALQISRDTRTDNAFGYAVIEENYQVLRRVALQHAARLGPAMLRVAFAALVIAAGVLFWILQPKHFTNAAARIMLPLANIDPLYETVLEVLPGNIEAVGDVTIHVHIRGRVPGELTVMRVVDGRRSNETVPVNSGSRKVEYTFKAVDRSMTYAVRGGDFTSPYYRIDVPTPASLVMVKATYQFPEYTRLGEKTAHSAGGEMEALIGTKANVVFVFDHPADAASMLLHKVNGGPETVQTLPLQKLSPTEFAGQITFVDVSGYQLETRQGKRPPHLSGRRALHVRADQDPGLQLAGVEKQTEVNVDAVVPLTIDASDDFGLQTVGLYARRASAEPQPANEGWKPVQTWPASGQRTFHQDFELSVATLDAVEGDKVEIAPRAADTDPLKNGTLITGQTFMLVIGGEGVALQLLYEQILRTEAEFKPLIASGEAVLNEIAAWIGKLDPSSGLRWDDQANLDALAAGMKSVAGNQENLRQASARMAREMAGQAGSLRLSVALLADTEMVRVIRILESIPTQDTVQAKRGALADAKMTQQRTLRSAREIQEQYVRFRQDWELANMIPFVRMLAERQAALRDESARASSLSAGATDAARQAGSARRQSKLVQLCDLSAVALAGLGERTTSVEPIMGNAFHAASGALTAGELKAAMAQATEFATAGNWTDAAARQDVAAKALAAIHQQLQEAKTEAAKQALAAIREQAKSDLEAQKAIERLRAGNAENSLQGIDESLLKMEEIIEMREQAAKRAAAENQSEKEHLYKFEGDPSALQFPDTGMRQEHDVLKLPTSPHGLPQSFPNQSDRKGNNIKPHIQQEFEDLVGDLMDEAELLKEKYDTYNLNMGVNINEAGDVGKQGGDMNSTAAAAATGNQKPPQHDQGGISRQGRLGARAHGMVMGDEGVNRRGRDDAQEAQERIPDQEGTIKQQASNDMQKDISTGVGGKQVETDDPTNFNVSDKGKFSEEVAEKMGKVAEKNVIVERQDGKIDPRIAEMLRDLNGTQEQVIERLKTIRKELKNLYLPTEQIDEAIAQLAANLEALKERPSADIFRAQAQTLDKLRRELKVFTQYGAGYQPSLPRDQAVRGRVLDEAARQPMPGYEQAVKTYYEKLSTTP